MSIPIHSGPSPINYSPSVARNQASNTGEQAALQGRVVEVRAHSQSSQTAVTQGAETLTYSKSVRTQSWSAQSVSTNVSAAATGRLVPPETNQYAGTILSAIEGQLMRDMADGADIDALASRLQAGLDGFLQGYNEALSQLQGLPGFDEGVRAQVEETRSQVLDGLAQFAAHHGIEYVAPEVTQTEASAVVGDNSRSPGSVSQEPKAVLGQKVLESAVRDLRILTEYVERSSREVTYQKQSRSNAAQNEQYAYQVQRQNSFAFNLKTQDGDIVTINVQASQFGYAGANASGDRASQWSQSKGVAFTVEGELDSDELEAINGLLGEVREIAAMFFEGDMDGAVSQALSLTYDDAEINAFDVHLNRSVTEAAFRGVGSTSQGETLERLQHKLASAVEQAGDLNQPKNVIADLTDWMAQQMNPQHHWSHNAGNLIKALL